MSSSNLHRITGSRFQHAKPGLCEVCKHRQDYGDWEGLCTIRSKILSYTSNPPKHPRCDDFAQKDAPDHANT